LRTTLKNLAILLFAVFTTLANAADKKIIKAKGDIALKCGYLPDRNGREYPLDHSLIYSPSNKAQFFRENDKKYDDNIYFFPLTSKNESVDYITFEAPLYNGQRHFIGVGRKTLRLVDNKHPSWASDPNWRDPRYFNCELMSDDEFKQSVSNLYEEINQTKIQQKEAMSKNKI
jgi:hypothetical protein